MIICLKLLNREASLYRLYHISGSKNLRYYINNNITSVYFNMSDMSSIFALFPVLMGVMLFGIWSNIHAYAQQSSSSPTLSAPSPPIGSSLSKPILPELKAKMCDPSNPSLKVVNTTEARICGIPKTVKPPLASAATTPQTSAVSSQSTQQTVTTKPTAVSAGAPTNYTFTATSPLPTSDEPLYLGYHGASSSTHDNGGSKHDDGSDSKPHIHSSTRSVSHSDSKDKDTSDGSSTEKKKTSSTNGGSSSKDKNSRNTESYNDHAADSGSSGKKRTKSDRTDSATEDGPSKDTCYYHHNSIINIKTCY
jgi:hypothetical protein